jgi:hypothetical protein
MDSTFTPFSATIIRAKTARIYMWWTDMPEAKERAPEGYPLFVPSRLCSVKHRNKLSHVYDPVCLPANTQQNEASLNCRLHFSLQPYALAVFRRLNTKANFTASRLYRNVIRDGLGTETLQTLGTGDFDEPAQ